MINKRKVIPISLLLLLLCLVILIGAIFFSYRQLVVAQKTFGASDPKLRLIQTIRYAWKLNRGTTVLSAAHSTPVAGYKFTIEMSESVRSICNRLETEGLVESADLVCTYLVYKGKDRIIQAGTFTIEPGLNGIQVADRISDPKERDILLTIFAGWRMEEIAESVDTLGFKFTGNDFFNLVSNPSEMFRQRLSLDDKDSLEGFLFPTTYSMKPEISLEAMIAMILDEFLEKTQTSEIINGFTAKGLTFYEGLTLASIIQRETLSAEEMPKIASVFYNRLHGGMKLETDPTVQYAIGYDQSSRTWWKQSLTLTDLHVNSPYNTYVFQGLPPGPISNPGYEAILAAATPEETPYLFFRVKCDGSMTHNFAVTYEEHLANQCN